MSHFTETRPLFELFPGLSERLRFADLAELPTPVHSLTPVMEALQLNGVEAYEKRDDLTSPRYGGNKVRTLEVLLGRALAAGVTRVYATGAYGSNHAAANALHAPRIGLEAGAVLYPQPTSPAAIENLALILSRRGPTVDLPHWSALPWGMWHTARRCRKRGVRAHVMVPGGATPQGALGYVSAGLELAAQVQRGELPAPRSIIVATGSNCTTAGLLVGLAIATRMGLGFSPQHSVTLIGVRVTPWPVTSSFRILGLAVRTAELLHRLSGDAVCALDRASLAAHFELDTRYIGSGYGHATEAGLGAVELWRKHVGHPLETTYSGKSAASFLDRLSLSGDRLQGPLLYWATKSSAVQSPVSSEDVAWAPRRMRNFIARGPHERRADPSAG
ncbi:MAG: pyridoxal-phosphate dependent enzyme [Polyangiaceae bacterium]